MKFDCEVTIDLDRDTVIHYWDNSDYMREWQDGLQSFDHMSGEEGKAGAKSRMFYKTGKREFELIETIIENNLPERFVGEYAAKSMVNTMDNSFTEIGPNQTKWEAKLDYTRFNGFLPKLMGVFMKGLFKKETQKWLNQFKEFAERKAAEDQA